MGIFLSVLQMKKLNLQTVSNCVKVTELINVGGKDRNQIFSLLV